MALKLGADYHINPLKEDFAERVLEITEGMGADMFMEATGLPEVVYPGHEICVNGLIEMYQTWPQIQDVSMATLMVIN